MKQEIAERWVQALRSGEYKQGLSRLRTKDDGYCCLGVLCDLASKEGVGEWNYHQSHAAWYYQKKGIEPGVIDSEVMDDVYIPKFVIEWAGMDATSNSGRYNEEEETKYLAVDNDGGKSFSEIATIIETKAASF